MDNTWLKKVDMITRHYYSAEKKNSLNLWIADLNKALLDDWDDCNNHTYVTPTENGDILEVEFKDKRMAVRLYDSDMKKSTLLDFPQFEKANYVALKKYGSHIGLSKFGIGYPYPDTMKNKLKSLRPGEIVTFSNGWSFWCTENDRGTITVQKICGDITKGVPLTSTLRPTKPFLIDFSYKTLQNLYFKVKNVKTDSVSARVSSINNTRVLVKSFADSLDKGASMRIDLGPIAINAQKPRMGGVIKWTGEDGEVYNEDQIALFFLWMATSPVIIEMRRKENTLETAYNDALFEEKIEALLSEFRFDDVCSEVAKYCLLNKGNVRVVFKSYIPSDKSFDYLAIGFLFTCEEGGVVIKRIEYDMNDISQRHVISKTINPALFTRFCEKKYNSDFSIIPNKKRQILRKGMPE